MSEKEGTDWGISIKSKKAVSGGEAVEITLEVSYESLGRAIEKLSATPFAAIFPSVAKIITFLKSLYVEEEIAPDDEGEIERTIPPKDRRTARPIRESRSVSGVSGNGK